MKQTLSLFSLLLICFFSFSTSLFAQEEGEMDEQQYRMLKKAKNIGTPIVRIFPISQLTWLELIFQEWIFLIWTLAGLILVKQT